MLFLGFQALGRQATRLLWLRKRVPFINYICVIANTAHGGHVSQKVAWSLEDKHLHLDSAHYLVGQNSSTAVKGKDGKCERTAYFSRQGETCHGYIAGLTLWAATSLSLVTAAHLSGSSTAPGG